MKNAMRVVAAGLAALSLTACGNENDAAPSAAASAVAKAAAAEKAEADRLAALEAERAKLSVGMVTPFASLADWTTACGAAGVEASICKCAGEKTVATLGEKGLYTWVWEGYVNRDGAARMRSGKFFTDAGLDNAAKQKFADAVGTCYTF